MDDNGDGDPDDTSGSSFSIGVSYPWGINYSYTTATSVTVDNSFYGTDPESNTWKLNGMDPNDQMQLVSAWKSDTSTLYAGLSSLKVEGNFSYLSYCCTQTATASASYTNIGWSYTSADSPGY